MKAWPRSALLALSVVAVIAAAAVVWHRLPTPTDIYGPFDVRANAGAIAAGRTLSATVTRVRISPRVNSVQAAGLWVVVDTTLQATRATVPPRSELIVGPNTYTPSDRFFGETLGAEIAPEINQQGSWVFDVAANLLAPGSGAPLSLRVWAGLGPYLDSRLVIAIPMDDVSRVVAVELQAPVASAS
jgi:hypothetical protein